MSTALAGDRTAAGPAPRSGRRALHGVLPVLLLLLAVLAGCSNDEPALPKASRSAGAGGTVSTNSAGVQVITLETGDDYVFEPNAFTVAPGQVELTVRNTAKQLTHNFIFTAGKGPAAIKEQIPVLAPGQSQTITFTVTTPGAYQFECSFHAALGQVGTMTVSG